MTAGPGSQVPGVDWQGSFIGLMNTASDHTIPHGDISEVGRKLEAIDEACKIVSQRLSLIEEHLVSISTTTARQPHMTATIHGSVSSSTVQTPQASFPVLSTLPIPRPISGSAMNTAADVRAIHAPEELFTLVAMKEFPDVLKRGLLTQDQVDMAFQMYVLGHCR